MENNNQLTKYPSASVRELLAIAVPLIISCLSANLMNLVDRLMLAYYSIDAMNAAAASSIASMALIYAALGITGISGVFAGQNNGAKKYAEVSRPVWQMIWLSLFTMIIFVPVAIWGAKYTVPDVLKDMGGLEYFRITMIFGFVTPMIAAVSGFFTGIGQTKIITVATIAGNILNLILDYLLIFGFWGFEPMGTKGAAIATVISQIINLAILYAIFFNKENRKKYKTLSYGLDFSYFKKCFKIGLPDAVSHAFEIGGWSVIFYLSAQTGPDYILVCTMGQNMMILFITFLQGYEKSIISISANLIGRKKFDLIPKLVKSATKLYGISLLIISFPLIMYPSPLIEMFDLGELSDLSQQYIINTFRFVWLYFVFDGFVWLFAGILTSAGDTRFIMIANSSCAWIIGVIPFYFFVYKFNLISPSYVWGMYCIYAVCNLLLVFNRYKSNKWKTIKI